MTRFDRVRPVALAPLVALALLATACSDDEPQGFTADSRSGFLAACTQPLDDSRLTSAICQCVFDETQAQLPFTRFREIDEALLVDPEAELSDDIVEIVATCIVDEGDL
jgi:hypothetical protein